MKSVPLAAVLCALLSMGAAPVFAEQAGSPETQSATAEAASPIRVIQQRAFLRSVRLELQLQGGLGVADSMYRHLIAVAQPRLHVTEHWSIGATYAHYFGEGSGLLDELTNGFELFPERSITKFYAGGDIGWWSVHTRGRGAARARRHHNQKNATAAKAAAEGD